jgi:hypothetical protein
MVPIIAFENKFQFYIERVLLSENKWQNNNETN